VQLPGYTDHVFDMRLAQEEGLAGMDHTALLPTYDLSCPHCPYGAVHNTDKEDVASRAVQQLLHMLYGEPALAGPRVADVSAAFATEKRQWSVSVAFTGGTAPFLFAGTRNCTSCCQNPAIDFDATADGETWTAGGSATLDGTKVNFLWGSSASNNPTLVRYTASEIFPQCAVYNQERLPAYPFIAPVRGKVLVV